MKPASPRPNSSPSARSSPKYATCIVSRSIPSQPRRKPARLPRSGASDQVEGIGEACLPPSPNHRPSSPSPPSPSPRPHPSGPTFPNQSTPIRQNQWSNSTRPTATFSTATNSPPPPPATSSIDELHDYARIYLDGKLAGKLDRRDRQSTLPITTTGPARLDILVAENSARINFSPAMRGEAKGHHQIRHPRRPALSPAGTSLYLAPLTDFDPIQRRASAPTTESSGNPHGSDPLQRPRRADISSSTSNWTASHPHLLPRPLHPRRHRRHLPRRPRPPRQRSPLDQRPHHRPLLEHPAPSRDLFVPGPWLRKGTNEIIAFDLTPTSATPTLTGLATPILDGSVIDTQPHPHKQGVIHRHASLSPHDFHRALLFAFPS